MPHNIDNLTRANAIIAASDVQQVRYSCGSKEMEKDVVCIAGCELRPSNKDDAEVLSIIAANPQFAGAKSVIESALREHDQAKTCVSTFLDYIEAGSDPGVGHDPYIGWELYMEGLSYPLYGSVRIVNAVLKALADEYRLAKASSPNEPMTDEMAKREMELVKEIINRHANMGWLASYGHDLNDGFSYSYWDGRYQARAEQEMEDAA